MADFEPPDFNQMAAVGLAVPEHSAVAAWRRSVAGGTLALMGGLGLGGLVGAGTAQAAGNGSFNGENVRRACATDPNADPGTFSVDFTQSGTEAVETTVFATARDGQPSTNSYTFMAGSGTVPVTFTHKAGYEQLPRTNASVVVVFEKHVGNVPQLLPFFNLAVDLPDCATGTVIKPTTKPTPAPTHTIKPAPTTEAPTHPVVKPTITTKPTPTASDTTTSTAAPVESSVASTAPESLASSIAASPSVSTSTTEAVPSASSTTVSTSAPASASSAEAIPAPNTTSGSSGGGNNTPEILAIIGGAVAVAVGGIYGSKFYRRLHVPRHPRHI